MAHLQVVLQAAADQSPRTHRMLPLVAAASREQAVQLAHMAAAFGATGGFCSADQVADRLRFGHAQPISRIARWIVDREVASCTWRGDILVPLFQFDGAPLQARPCMAGLLRELDARMDDWESCLWFATGHECLDGRTPAAALRAGDTHGVMQAVMAS